MTSRCGHGMSRLSRTEKEKEIETEKETSVLRYAQNGAPSAPSGSTPLGANEVVAAYVRGRSEAGLPTDARLRGICGRYARQLLAARSWDKNILLDAVQQFGASKRSPRYLGEWASQVVTEQEIAGHKQRKAEEAPKPERGLRSVADVLAGMRVA